MEKPPHRGGFFLPIALFMSELYEKQKNNCFSLEKYKIERIFAYLLTRLKNKEKRNKNGKIR